MILVENRGELLVRTSLFLRCKYTIFFRSFPEKFRKIMHNLLSLTLNSMGKEKVFENYFFYNQ